MTNKKVLLISSVFVLPVMSAVFYVLSHIFNSYYTFLSGMTVYWVYLFSITLLTSETIPGLLKNIFTVEKKKLRYLSFALLPAAIVLYVAFIPNFSYLTHKIILVVLLMSVINGITEEAYWRGLYLVKYKDNELIGFYISTILFGAWHFSLLLIKDIQYQSGTAALVGGSLLMGFIWNYVTRKTGSIKYSAAAHVLSNIFSFSGLFVLNNF